MPLEVVQKTLGHTTSRTTTEFYQKFSGAQLAEGLGFTRREENSGVKNLDVSRNLTDTHGATSMNTNPRQIHDDSLRASAGGVDVAINASGVQARIESPCVSGPGLAAPSSQSHLRDLNPGPMLCESTGRGIRREDAGLIDSPTGHILILAERAVSGVVAAERSGRSSEFVRRFASIATNAVEALGLRLNRQTNPSVTA